MHQLESTTFAWAVAAAMAFGAFAGMYAWRTAVRYATGLQAGAAPDTRFMLCTLAARRQVQGAEQIARRRHGVLAAFGLAMAYGWLCFQAIPLAQWLALLLFLFLMLLLACIDAYCGLLPDALTLPLLLAGLGASALDAGQVGLTEALLVAALAYGVLLGLAWLFRRLRGRDGLGGGDIKCIAAIGAWSGLQGLLVVMVVSSLLGLLYALTMGRKQGLAASYPFGPCLMLAVVAWLVLQLQS